MTSNDKQPRLANTLILTASAAVENAQHLLPYLMINAKLTDRLTQACVAMTEDMESGQSLVQQVLEHPEAAFNDAGRLEAIVALGATVSSLGLQYDNCVPCTIYPLEMLGASKVRALYLPSANSSWWAETQNVDMAVAAIRDIFSIENIKTIEDFVVPDALSMDVSTWN